MIFGIDFGTTNSLIAYLEGGEVRLIPGADGAYLTPSVVAVGNRGEFIVGSPAKAQALLHPDRTLANLKRDLGTADDVVLGGRHYPRVELASLVFKKLRDDARAFTGGEPAKAVVTVPAYFNDAARKAVREAAHRAGWDVERLVSEPTAAAMTLGEGPDEDEAIVVFDLGGGTFDVSVLIRHGGIFEVRAASGHNHLGGMDFDRLFLDHIAQGFRAAHRIDLRQDPLASQKLSEAVEAAKIELSRRPTVRLKLPFISANESGPLHLDLEVPRGLFENLIADRLRECLRLTEQTVVEAGLSHGDIRRVLLVGGSCLIPKVAEGLAGLFPSALMDLEAPLERVARGAAVQASILEGTLRDQVLVDVTPFSLGIEIDHGYFATVIKKNTPIPVTEERLFTTLADDQKSVEVHILQGEGHQSAENFSLGRFVLEDIRRAPKGIPRIQVRFDLDVSGTLEVSARDLDTGRNHAFRLHHAAVGAKP
ncbi:MAG: Hsp70 family protein [Spirochaetes bacterium]|nr:Hsp70 family protein [Spirochaetota bacterium]